MLKQDVLNWKGDKVSQVDLDETIFSDKYNVSLLQEVVRWQLARRRSGTHKTKTRSEVRGGGRKPFRQKGTGRARQGSIRSPLLEGGGVTHGPQPRSYDWALPKKVKQKALRQALAYLYSKKNIIFIENMNSENGKTKDLKSRLDGLKLTKALLIDEKREEKFQRACKNIPKFKFIRTEGLNVYDLLKFDKALITPSALKVISKRCGV